MFDAYQHTSRFLNEKLNLHPHYLDGLFLVLTSCQTLGQKSVSELYGSEKITQKRTTLSQKDRDINSQSRHQCETVITLWIPECVTFRHPPAFIKLGSITPLLTLTMATPFPRVSAAIKQLPKCQAEHKGY